MMQRTTVRPLRSAGFLAVVALVVSLAVPSAAAFADASSAAPAPSGRADAPAAHPMPSWFTDAKFGIFIHWGVYSVPAWAPVGTYAEWYWLNQMLSIMPTYQHHLDTYGKDVRYDDFIDRFRPGKWDPADWIKLFEDAGAKYWVLTAKHHDGFALWPTKTSDRNAVALGPHRDLVGDLFAANEGSGLKGGVYYSLPEWFTPAPRPRNMYPGFAIFDAFRHPQDPYAPGTPAIPYRGYKPIKDYATGQVIPQIDELIDRYHPSVLWCDIGGDPAYYRSASWLERFYADGAAHHPEGVVANDRCGLPGDFATPEYEPVPATPTRPFESTRGLGASFGYNCNEAVTDYLTDAEAIHTLIDTVAGGGNLLLDIGPRADGTIPRVMRDRLLAMGDWLHINGEAIYGTAPWTGRGTGTLRYTVGKDGSFYAIAEAWPGKQLVLPATVPVRPSSRVTLLGAKATPLHFARRGGKVVVTLPAGWTPASTTSKHAFVFKVTNASYSELGPTTPRAPHRDHAAEPNDCDRPETRAG